VAEADNEEIVRRAIDAWNRGDLEAAVELGRRDVEITLAGVFPDLQRVYRGHEGFREFWELFRGAWNQIWIELKEIEARGESVYAATLFHGVGRDDIPVERPFHFAFHIRDGEIAAYETFSDRAPARAAAGLDG
jgi:ketosteroid isomerase-like protein